VTLISTPVSTVGFKNVRVSLPDGHAPVRVVVHGKMPDDSWGMLRDSICYGGETLDLPVNVIFVPPGEPVRLQGTEGLRFRFRQPRNLGACLNDRPRPH
jgi:hypothetical protein